METTSSTSATAAAPAAAASSPAASTAGAPTTAAPTTATSTPAAKEGTAGASQTSQPQSLEQRLSAKIMQGFEGNTDSSATQSATEAAAAGAEQTAASEAKANEAASATEGAESGTGTETDAGKAQGESNQADDEDEFESAPSSITGPRDLASKIDANPAIKEAINSDPEFRDLIFANARLAAKAQPYTEMFGSPEEAQAVLDGHQSYLGIRNLLGSVKRDDFGSTQAVITAMLEQDAMRDEEGNPLKDESGNLVTGGNTGRFLRNALSMRLAVLEQQAKAAGDDEALAALDLIMERAGLRAPSSAGEDEMSEELKTQRSQIEQQQRELDEQRAQGRREAQEQHDQRVFSRIGEALDKSITRILDKATGLTPFARSAVDKSIRGGLREALRKNSAYQTELDRIERMPVGAKREAAHVALAQRYIQSHLLNVARPVLSEAGISLTKAAAEKKAAEAARAENARSEVRGSGAPARTTAQPSQAERSEQIKTELTQKLGRAPTLEELLAARIAPAFAERASA